MGLIKKDGFTTLYSFPVNGGVNVIEIDIGEHTPPFLREGDYLSVYVDEMTHYIKYTDLLLLAQLAEEWRSCEHDWIDVTNPPIITGGWWCSKCNRVKGGNIND